MKSSVRWGLALLGFMTACESGESVTRTITETISLQGGESMVILDTRVPVLAQGSRQNQIDLTLEATVTASSAETAEAALEAYQIVTETSGGSIRVILGEPSKGRLSGRATFLVPDDIALQVLGRAGTSEVTTMASSIDLQSAGAGIVRSSTGDINVAANGGAVVETGLNPGQLVSVLVGEGNIDLRLPVTLDASFDVNATEGILFEHPSFAPVSGLTIYRGTVGAGLTIIQATTRAGVARIGVR